MLLTLVIAFGSGVVSFLAPCTVPLLPAYVSVLSGSAGGATAASTATPRLVRGALLYVLGFTTVFVALGTIAGSVGAVVRASAGPVQQIGGAFVVVLAIGLLLASRGRGPLARLSGLGSGARSRLSGSTSWAMPLLLGVVFGTAFTPCVGPFLGGVLTVAASDGGALRGGLLLAVYGLGLGLPFVVTALALASNPGLVRRLSRASAVASLVGGVLLLVLGAALLSGEYSRVAGWFARVLPFPTV